MTVINLLRSLIETSALLGLKESDIKNSKELLEQHEFGLSFDTIITQLYEYDIEINEDFFKLIKSIANKLKLSEESYVFIKQLVRSEMNIPSPVKEKLADIIKSLDQSKE